MMEIVQDLIYLSYFHNRKLSPDVTPEQWAGIFGPRVKDLENRFQAEFEAANDRRPATVGNLEYVPQPYLGHGPRYNVRREKGGVS
jgi:hypothetical protein